MTSSQGQFLAHAKVKLLPALQIADAERFLTTIRGKRSAKTRDHYAGALRGFARWRERTERWDTDPLRNLRVKIAKRDKLRVLKRVSFRFAEVKRLVEAAWARHLGERDLPRMPARSHYGETVQDRQVLYWFVSTTGARANECTWPRWADLRFAGDRLSARLDGKLTRNSDDAVIPLQVWVPESLARRSGYRTYRASRARRRLAYTLLASAYEGGRPRRRIDLCWEAVRAPTRG